MVKPANINVSNLTINCLGDSLTWGDNGINSGGPAISWVQHIQSILAFKAMRNYGVCGSRIAITPDHNDSFVERYATMPDDANIIIVFGGVNDFQHDVPLGTATGRDTKTFHGALNTLVTGLTAKYPDSNLIFMTPPKNDFHSETKHYPTTFQKNKLGHTQLDYVAAMKRVCSYYSLPVIDLYEISGISPFLPEHMPRYMPDGLHYSDTGYARLSHRIAGALLPYLL
ncbi:MAG: SGNH/GDSL hydrolase family protein [Lactobacillus sp.]|nr:SGNH/GDSL hydrolase family protein [Lactobacillus sp.]